MASSNRGVFRRIRDGLEIIRVWREARRQAKANQFVHIQGVPVNILGNLQRNESILNEVEYHFGGLDPQFEMAIMLVSEALKAVGKYFETDKYLERSVLDGAKEKDAYKHFIVERREVDRALLIVCFDRDKLDALPQLAKDHQSFVSQIDHSPWARLQKRAKDLPTTIIDDSFSSETFRQVDYYLQRLFEEESVIHILGPSGKIVRILRLPYELPKQIYLRRLYEEESFPTLTEWWLTEPDSSPVEELPTPSDNAMLDHSPQREIPAVINEAQGTS